MNVRLPSLLSGLALAAACAVGGAGVATAAPSSTKAVHTTTVHYGARHLLRQLYGFEADHAGGCTKAARGAWRCVTHAIAYPNDQGAAVELESKDMELPRVVRAALAAGDTLRRREIVSVRGLRGSVDLLVPDDHGGGDFDMKTGDTGVSGRITSGWVTVDADGSTVSPQLLAVGIGVGAHTSVDVTAVRIEYRYSD